MKARVEIQPHKFYFDCSLSLVPMIEVCQRVLMECHGGAWVSPEPWGDLFLGISKGILFLVPLLTSRWSQQVLQLWLCFLHLLIAYRLFRCFLIKIFVRLTEIFKTKSIFKDVCKYKKNAIVTERGLFRHSRIRTPLTWLGAQVRRKEPREQGRSF